jgi:hypothetical protein
MPEVSAVRSRGSDSAAPALEAAKRRWAATYEQLPALKPIGRQEKVQSSWSYPRIRQQRTAATIDNATRNERNVAVYGNGEAKATPTIPVVVDPTGSADKRDRHQLYVDSLSANFVMCCGIPRGPWGIFAAGKARGRRGIIPIFYPPTPSSLRNPQETAVLSAGTAIALE